MRCARCDAEIDAKQLGGLCPVCLLDAARPDEQAEVDDSFRYDLIEEIARGGMGVVYRAIQHGSQRQVAVKMILVEQAATPGIMERFRAEAEAVASLDHSHILPIYEIGESEGRPFYSMKFANGGTLRDCAAHFARPRDAARLIATIARAVHHAHERGILHRDLKPGNVLLDGAGRTPYVSDFGLAKWIGRDSRLTLASSALGTPHYIAPEQAAGASQKLTAAADVYSLGAILYELLAGRPPFVADTPLETLQLSRETQPPLLRSIEPAVPRDLETICLKCLAKDPSARYQSAAALAQDLERWLQGETILARPATTVERAWSWTRRNRIVAGLSAALAMALFLVALVVYQRLQPAPRSVEVPAKSIAILPFETRSRDPENVYLAQGIQDEILTRLSKIAELKVISRGSTERFGSSSPDLRQISQQLGVAHVLRGSVHQNGDKLRISVKLINATTDAQLWAETYDRKLTDVFEVEREVATAITRILQTKLTGKEAGVTASQPPQNPAARQLYLKARYFWSKRTGDDLKKAADYLNQAIAADPAHALAYAGLADAYVLMPFYGAGTPQECYPKAKTAAKKALEIDETLAEAHVALAEAMRVGDLDLAGAEKEFRRGLELDPNYANGHHWYGNGVLTALGRFDEAIAEMKRALELDPLSLIINADLGTTYFFARRYDAAVEQYRKTLEMDAGFYYAHWGLAVVLETKGSFDAALAEYETARRLNDDPWVMALEAHAYGAAGNHAQARKLVDEVKELSKSRYVSTAAFTVCHLALNEKAEAIRSLEKGFAEHAGADLQYINVDPYFDSLRGDPQFDALASRIIPPSNHLTPLVVPNKSIAVLPFDNLSGQDENAAFANGMQDEILTHLAKIADLKVISRTSVMSYTGGVRRNLREIGQQLGAAHLLEGSVQRTGNRVRVNAQLIDARSDSHLWAQTYDRDLADVFAIQTEIARAISDQLQAKLSPLEKAAIAEPPTRDLAAFDLYSRAKALLTGMDTSDIGKNNLLQAVQLLEQAVGRDPAFIQGYCRMASAHDSLYSLFDHTPARLALAEAAIQRALQLAPDAAEVHLALAQHFYQGREDFDRARAEVALAQKTLPNSPLCFFWDASIDRRQGRWSESIRKFQRSVELDPRNGDTYMQLALTYQHTRHYLESSQALDRILALAPKDQGSRVMKAGNDLLGRADTVPLHSALDSILKEDPGAARQLADSSLYVAFCERDSPGARRAIDALAGGPIRWNRVFLNHDFLEGLLARVSGDAAAAQAAFTAARKEQEKLVAAQPDYGPAVCALGLIDAGLGRKEDALREGRRAIDLLPVTKDSVNGALMIKLFALMCAWVGEKDLAFEQLAKAAQLPGHLHYGELQLHPIWNPLRGDSRFGKIVATIAPISTSPPPKAP
jgi:TolB-like protein/Tfp pilus assembly protein PilF